MIKYISLLFLFVFVITNTATAEIKTFKHTVRQIFGGSQTAIEPQIKAAGGAS